MARTIGAQVREDPVAPGRSNDVLPFLGMLDVLNFPLEGRWSFYEPWDAGAAFNSLAPNANIPPIASASNQDPHGVPRRTPAAQQQKSDHLRIDGTITDRCGGGPCQGVP